MEKNIKKEMTGYASIDKPWLKYYDLKSEEITLPRKTMYEFVKSSNSNNMKNVALDVRVSSNGFKKGIKITYGDFFKSVDNMGKSSTKLGIKKDDIVPIILPNVPEARKFIYSNSCIGATSYPISPLLASSNLEAIIKENGIKNLVVFSAFYDKFKDAINNSNLDSIIYLDGTESIPEYIKALKSLKDKISGVKANDIPRGDNIISWKEYNSLKKLYQGDITPVSYKKDHVAAIIGTSGTTGTSKGVCLTDDNINAAAIEYRDGKCFEGKFLDALLPSIGYGISMLHYQMANGHYIYLIPELVTDKTAQMMQVLKPDTFPGGPVHYINLSRSEEFKNGTLHRAKNYISGGATLNSEIEKTLNGVEPGYVEKGINDNIFVRQGFGLSENVATGSYSKRGAYKFGSIGIPLPYSTVGIFKPGTDEELKYSEEGELCISGPTVMKGYLNNQEETDKVIKVHKDGKKWIHTKDIVTMDEDGFIFFKERIKNIFMRTGFNVHPNKIAEFINTMPFVQNSYVMGFDHPTEQCVPVAFIVLEKNLEKTEEELLSEIESICYENLEETSVPYEFVFVKELPINAGGKIDGMKLQKESGIDYMKNVKKLTKTIDKY